MIQIVMKPDYDAKVVSGENLYMCFVNGEDIGLRVRGRKAAHAEEKLMELFKLDLKGKTLDYDLEAYRKAMQEKGQCADGAEAKEEVADKEGGLADHP